MAKTLSFPKVMVEFDCSPTVRSITEGREDLSTLGHLVEALQLEFKRNSE